MYYNCTYDNIKILKELFKSVSIMCIILLFSLEWLIVSKRNEQSFKNIVKMGKNTTL